MAVNLNDQDVIGIEDEDETTYYDTHEDLSSVQFTSSPINSISDFDSQSGQMSSNKNVSVRRAKRNCSTQSKYLPSWIKRGKISILDLFECESPRRLANPINEFNSNLEKEPVSQLDKSQHQKHEFSNDLVHDLDKEKFSCKKSPEKLGFEAELTDPAIDLMKKVVANFKSIRFNRNLIFENKLNQFKDYVIETLKSKPNPALEAGNSYSLGWLEWREKNYPHGAILTNDIGLGKTLIILAYLNLVKNKLNKDCDSVTDSSSEDELSHDYYKSTNTFLKKAKSKKLISLKTLVIMPASSLPHWQNEIRKHFTHALTFFVYHGTNRTKYSK